MTAQTSNLRLDDQHRYWLTTNGTERQIPGVTSVIAANVTGWQAGQFYLDRGHAVHLAVRLALEGHLDRASLDPRIAGRVDSILKFIDAQCLVAFAVEKQLASERYRFAGTLDFVGMTTCDDGTRILADWKGSIGKAAEIQLGAYTLLWDECESILHRAVAVECNDDGTYRCQWFTYRELKLASQIFLAMLTVFNFREKHGLNKKEL